MINKKKISIGLVILGLIAILVLVVFLYHSKQELKQNQASISLGSDLLLKSDIIPFTYKDFLNNDLQKICPFGLSGVAYRDCLVTLLENREKTVDQTYSDIVRDLRAVHEKDMTLSTTDGDLQWPARQSFLENLAVLYKTWKPYRDALCVTENSNAWGGSGQSGFVNECRLYQTALFEAQLLEWRHDWIGGSVRDATPKETYLDEECPFISTAYTGDCLDKVLASKEKEVDSLVKSLVESTNSKIKEGPDFEGVIPYEYSLLLSSLDEYNKQWISYRNEKCDLINSYIGGTAIVEESRKCYIHETDEYIQILKDLEAWVNGKSK